MFSSLIVRTETVVVGAVLVTGLLLAQPVQVGAQQNEITQFDAHMGILALQFVADENLEEVLTNNPLLEIGYDLITGPGAYNPFKGDVTYDDIAVEATTITETYAAVIYPAGTDPLPGIDANPDVTVGSLQDQLNSIHIDFEQPPPNADVDVEVTNPDGSTRIVTVVGGLGPLIDALPGSIDEPMLVLGARTQAPQPSPCIGVRRESGVFFDTPLTNWDASTGADPEAFNDFFLNGDTALINRCVDGANSTHRIEFQGPGNGFAEIESPILRIRGPLGWMMFVPAGQVLGVGNLRFLEFVTDIRSPYVPDSTAASVAPTDLNTLLPITKIPAIPYDSTKDRPASQVPDTTTTSSSTTSTTSGATTSSTAEPGAAPPGGGPEAASALSSDADPFGWLNGPTLMFIGAILIAMGFAIGRWFFNVGVDETALEELDGDAK